MANLHILSQDEQRVRAVLHVDIPAANNAAGVSWRSAVLRNGFGTTILPDGDGTLGTVSAAEKALIQSGARVEIVRVLKFGQAPTVAELDVLAARESSAFLTDFQLRFNRYGMTR
jgi:hypothetical protein